MQRTAKKVHETGAEVYAVTLSRDYSREELELYTGKPEFLYVDERISQFLTAAGKSVAECPGNVATTVIFPEPTTLPQIEEKPSTIPAVTPAVTKSPCQKDIVDLLLVIDTSGSVADAFLNERSFAEKLVQVVPPGDFNSRVSVACVRFDKTAQVEFSFEPGRDQATVLKKIQDIEFTGGQTSLVAGFNSGLAEIAKGRRPNSRLVIVLVSGWCHEFF